jgi:alcohol dehydrogenase (cytochrome c)
VAEPNEPGGDTWNSIPAEKLGGAAIWVSGQYGRELNLTYWGTGNPPPWRGIARGTANEITLYNNSTLALDPDTGKLVWYNQHLGPDHYDIDYPFERTIAPVEFQGRSREAVLAMGKPGILEALDAATGQFLFARDSGAGNVATSIDPVNGAKSLLPYPLPPRALPGPAAMEFVVILPGPTAPTPGCTTSTCLTTARARRALRQRDCRARVRQGRSARISGG